MLQSPEVPGTYLRSAGAGSLFPGPSENTAADTAEEEEYYYIKEVDGVVKVFACQGEEKKLYLITSIPFELLSQTDQNMFSKGVTKKTKAELDEFLENFDS